MKYNCRTVSFCYHWITLIWLSWRCRLLSACMKCYYIYLLQIHPIHTRYATNENGNIVDLYKKWLLKIQIDVSK